MFGLGHSNNAPVYAALIDVASGSVGIAIIASDPQKKIPQILYTRRSSMRIEKYTDGNAEDIRRVREAILASSLVLSQEGSQALRAHNPKSRITLLYVTIASPWSHTVPKTVQYTSDDAFKVTAAMVDDLIQSAETEILAHITESTAIATDAFDIIERTTTNITVNDYVVQNPLNLTGTVLGLSHIAGLISKEITATLSEVHSKLFADATLRVYTHILVMYFAVQELYPRTQTVCIINVTGEATELGIIENGTLVYTTFIPEGSGTLVRKIMERTGKPATDICTSIQNADAEIVSNFDTYAESYTQSVAQMLAGILEQRMLPSQIIITAHKPYERFFTDTLKKIFTQVLGKEPVIMQTPLSLIAETASGIENDTYLALNARFFHKIQQISTLE